MALTKKCEQCGQEFEKPKSCGLPEWGRRRFCSTGCKAASQIGSIPSNKGTRRQSTARKIPCRICGKPTIYNGTERNKLYGKVHCHDGACAEASRILKNENISDRHKSDYNEGKRKPARHSWDNVGRVSREEDILAPFVLPFGFVRQHKLLTKESSIFMPRCFWLDFAMPSRKLCIEVDGSVHRLRKERDARKDAMLKERGWNVLRIPASHIVENIDGTIELVRQFISSS